MSKIVLTNTNISTPLNWPGGDGSIILTGDFGGGTVAPVISPDGNDWVALKDSTGTAMDLSANGAISFSVAACKLRLDYTGTSAQGAATMRSLTVAGPAVTTATATVPFYAQPIVGDTITKITHTGSETTYTFIANGVTPVGNQIALGTTLAATLTAIVTKMGTSSVSGTSIIFTSSTSGTDGNKFTIQVRKGIYARANTVAVGGRAAGTVTTAGNLTITFAAPSLNIASFTTLVPLAVGDTLAIAIDKIRTLMAKDPRTSHFDFTTTASTIVVSEVYPFKPVDSSLIFSITAAGGTGYTTAASTQTQSGVATRPLLAGIISER